MPIRLTDLRSRFSTAISHQGGVSAVEFALIAPLLVACLLSMVDIGFAIYQRMALDHVLRAAAQSAMTDAGDEKIRQIIEATASQNFTVGGTSSAAGKPSMTYATERYCVCPGSGSVKTACNTICGGTLPTRAYYTLAASSTFKGKIYRSIVFNPSLQVQVR